MFTFLNYIAYVISTLVSALRRLENAKGDLSATSIKLLCKFVIHEVSYHL